MQVEDAHLKSYVRVATPKRICENWKQKVSNGTEEKSTHLNIAGSAPLILFLTNFPLASSASENPMKLWFGMKYSVGRT